MSPAMSATPAMDPMTTPAMPPPDNFLEPEPGPELVPELLELEWLDDGSDDPTVVVTSMMDALAPPLDDPVTVEINVVT